MKPVFSQQEVKGDCAVPVKKSVVSVTLGPAESKEVIAGRHSLQETQEPRFESGREKEACG